MRDVLQIRYIVISLQLEKSPIQTDSFSQIESESLKKIIVARN